MELYNNNTSRVHNSIQRYQSRPRLARVSRRQRCPVCDHANWCSVSADGVLAFCMRVSAGSVKTASNGAYIHRLIDDYSPPQKQYTQRPQPTPTIEVTPRASDERITAVYADLLRVHLVLSEPHRRHLRERGLNDLAIGVNAYASAPSPEYARSVARALARDHDLEGVPGFYRDAGEWQMSLVKIGEAIIIPVRNSRGRIIALMYRRMDVRPGDAFGKYLWFSSGEDKDGRPREGGAASGAPCHFANVHLLREAREVTLAEGILKAQVAAHLLNQPVIGNAPSCFGADFAENLKAEFPRLRTVYVAFDMDFTRNEQVHAAMERLTEQLERARFDVRVRTWSPEWKGIDDYLLAVSQQEVAA
jgi:hypothetical protein